MRTEKRPTSVTVIGWIWIIFGGLNSLSGLYVVLAMRDANAKDMPDDGFPFW